MPAGSFLLWDNGVVTREKNWRVESENEEERVYSDSFENALEELDRLLSESIRERLTTSNEIGALLSSGIDSSLITAMAQKEIGSPVHTFTLGIKDDETYNEAELAKTIAKKIGTIHHELYISENDLLSFVKDIASYMDEPFGDAGLVPMMFISKFAKEYVPVVFGGDGGDEMFEGYPHFKFVRQAQYYDFAGRCLSKLLPERIVRKMPHKARHIIENTLPYAKTQLLIPSELEMYGKFLIRSADPPYFSEIDIVHIDNWETRRQILDLLTAFPDGTLQKSELATRCIDLDLRSPLVDKKIAEFTLKIPNSFKLNGSIRKHILRELAYKYVSKELLNLPKRGFCMPTEKWMNSVLSSVIKDYSSPVFIEKQGLFSINQLNTAIKDSYALRWNFFVFQCWYERFINN